VLARILSCHAHQSPLRSMGREKRVILRCRRCAAQYERVHVAKCKQCGGIVDPCYDLTRARIADDDGDSLRRYFDLLPLESSEHVHGGCEPTPLVHARELGHRYELDQLWLKDETGHPTRTTKDRMAACTLSRFQELGIGTFVASSTGNSSTSFAHWIDRHARGKLHAHLFSGAGWVSRHQYCDHGGVSLHVVEGTFVQTGAAAKAYAVEHELIWEGGFFNPSRREGLKLAYLEALDALPREPTVIIQAISSGMGLYGGWRGACEYRALGRLRSTPRFVCVQQRSCAPMVRSFESGSAEVRPEFIVENPTGIAEAILRGDPTASYPYMHRIVTATNGTFIDVTREEIEIAQRTLMEDEGFRACPASAAAIAATRKLRSRGFLTAEDVVLVNVAGGMRPEAYGCVDDAQLDETLTAAPAGV
jgi:threonine synthase